MENGRQRWRTSGCFLLSFVFSFFNLVAVVHMDAYASDRCKREWQREREREREWFDVMWFRTSFGTGQMCASPRWCTFMSFVMESPSLLILFFCTFDMRIDSHTAAWDGRLLIIGSYEGKPSFALYSIGRAGHDIQIQMNVRKCFAGLGFFL